MPDTDHRSGRSSLWNFYRRLWTDYFKYPIDNLPIQRGTFDHGEYLGDQAISRVREYFFKAEWYEVLDFIEFSCYMKDPVTVAAYNHYLKREISAYRIIESTMVEINSEEEIAETETAIKQGDKFKSVKVHLKSALDLLADRVKPDYRNSIKESISAVESIAKIITEDNSKSLGPLLKIIEAKYGLPGSLKSAFSSLYGYTSSESGIRHALLEENVTVDIEEARFMLITCSAFVNYLISKM